MGAGPRFFLHITWARLASLTSTNYQAAAYRKCNLRMEFRMHKSFLPSLSALLSQSLLKWIPEPSIVCRQLNRALFLHGYVSVPMCIITENNYKGEVSARSKVKLLWILWWCLLGRCSTDWFKHSPCVGEIWELCFVNCVCVDRRGQLCSSWRWEQV